MSSRRRLTDEESDELGLEAYELDQKKPRCTCTAVSLEECPRCSGEYDEDSEECGS